MKMTVLYAKHTGHVMAALTRAVVAEAPSQLTQAQKLEAEAAEARMLAGSVLVVRDFLHAATGSLIADQFLIPAEQIAARTSDPEENILLSPRDYARDPEDKLMPLGTPTPSIQTVAINANRDAVVVTLQNAVSADTPVWVHIRPTGQTTGDPQIALGIIRASQREIALNVRTLPAGGNYFMLTLVSGYRPIIFPG